MRTKGEYYVLSIPAKFTTARKICTAGGLCHPRF
jgi:hypothetical protein